MIGLRVVGLGATCVDQQMLVDRIPRENEKDHAKEFRVQVGSPVPTALAQLSKLGCDCYLISNWGDDYYGNFIEKDLESTNIRFSDCCRNRSRGTGVAHVWVNRNSGSRTILATSPCWTGCKLSELDMVHLSECDMLHVDCVGGDIAVQAVKHVSQRGGRVLVDVGSRKDATEEVLQYADICIVQSRFAKEFLHVEDPELACRSLHMRGIETVVYTCGERGAFMLHGDKWLHVAAFEVDARDTCGAGDVFAGVFGYGVLIGWTMEECLHAASAGAALKCSQIGNRSCLPSLEELLASLRQWGHEHC